MSLCRKMDYFIYMSKTSIHIDVEGVASKIVADIKPAKASISLIVEKASVYRGVKNV